MNMSDGGARFPTTCWSRVADAANPDSPDAREALSILCTVYWYPLYALIRREGYADQAALDLTQSYFERLLKQGTFSVADREKGRLRTFLRLDCKHFLVDEYRKQNTRAKVPQGSFVSIDVEDAEGRYRHEPVDHLTPERIFERTWTLALLDRTLKLLSQEYAEAGKEEEFELLKNVLTDDGEALPGAELAVLLGKPSRNAAYQTTVRFKKRYRMILREQIAETLEDPSQVDDEMLCLFDAIRA